MTIFTRLPRRYARIGEHRVAYAVVGSGPAVLLLHGLGGTADFWQPLLDQLGGRYALLCPDLLGFGFSDTPAVAYTLARHTAAMLAVVRDAGIAQFHGVVGHSVGGVVVVALLASGLLTTRRLVLAATPYPSPRFPLRKELVTSPWFGRLLDNRRLARIDDTVWRRAVWPLASRLVRVPPYLRGGLAGFMDYSVDSFYGTAQELLFRADVGPLVARLPALPTLLLYGRDDQTVPPIYGRRLQEALPAATLIEAEGGHYGVIHESRERLVHWLAGDG
ncbi:MAG: alpha/beta fold hydrolase [Chloroflexales bacterium]|nr:alpha/beta fold hydrolase [Chloroflexales bacterium]